MRPAKSTCSRLLKACEELTEAERHDLAEVLSRWSHGEEHARRGPVLGDPDDDEGADVQPVGHIPQDRPRRAVLPVHPRHGIRLVRRALIGYRESCRLRNRLRRRGA